MNVSIDRVGLKDEAAWRALWRDYLAFYETERADELYRRNFSQLATGIGPMFGYVARAEDDVPIGLAHYFVHGTGWSIGDTCYLQDLYVLPVHRGGGVAATLIEAVATDARLRGCERLYWLTHTDNQRARALYDRVAHHEGFLCYERAL